MKSKMIHESQGEKTFALIFDTGDEAMAGLVEFARANKLGAARFTAIGAFRDVTLVREGTYLRVRGGLMPHVEAEQHFTAQARERDTFAAAAVWRGFDGADMRVDAGEEHGGVWRDCRH